MQYSTRLIMTIVIWLIKMVWVGMYVYSYVCIYIYIVNKYKTNNKNKSKENWCQTMPTCLGKFQ